MTVGTRQSLTTQPAPRLLIGGALQLVKPAQAESEIQK